MVRPCFYSQYGYSALIVSASGGYSDIVVELITAGANLDLQNKVHNNILLISALGKV